MAAKDVVELWKSVFDLLKGLLIAALIFLFIAAPGVINKGLSSIGIKEFDLWGLKGSTVLAQVAQDLEDQKAVGKNLSERLEKTSALLTQLTAERDDLAGRIENLVADAPGPAPALPDSVLTDATVSPIVAANDIAIDAAAVAWTNAAQTLEAYGSTIAAAQAASSPSAGGWAVVYGADATEQDARSEIERAESAGFSSARVYLRQKWHRSVIEFPSREAASAALDKVKALSSTATNAYVVSLPNWCPNRIERRPDLVECQA